MTWILHVDMDAYFASIEEREHPELRGVPLIVGGLPRTRTTVACASYAARRFGVRAGMSTSEARRRCPRGVFRPVDPPLYIATSRRLFEFLWTQSRRVEPAGLDEAYLEIEADDPRAAASKLQADLEAAMQLPASVGVSDSKALAKFASKLGKPHGVTLLQRAEVEGRIWPLPVRWLRGVGEKTAARLERRGYRTIGDVAQAPAGALESLLGARGVALRRLATGQDGGRVTPPEEAPDARSIGREHTLDRDLDDRSRVEAVIRALALQVGERARRWGLVARRVTLELCDINFRSSTHGRVMPQATADVDRIARVACELFGETRSARSGVRRVGVRLEQLVRDDALTLPFGPSAPVRAERPPERC